uniref:Uncharacterized protein n=1 Tax=viral metagenome TaxID=1070528 RepID=A0A6H2A3A6_9ZZZZ
MIAIISLDKQELQAIVLLKRVPEFKSFLDVLNRSIATLSYSNAMTKDEVISRWNQGRLQELIDITNKIKTADEELHAFKTEARQHVE